MSISTVEKTTSSIPSPAAPLNPVKRNRLQERAGDRLFRYTMMMFAGIIVALALAMAIVLSYESRFAWKEFGLKFLWTSTWDPVEEIYGALPYIYGTIVSSLLALLISVPLGLGAAIFLAEMAPKKISNALIFLIELLAAVPSVIIGLMGIFVLVPAVAYVQPFFIKYLGFMPFFSGQPYGIGMFSAGLVLAIMILPYITSISRDVLLSVPTHLKEASYGLGATRWETIKMVCLPFAKSGIFGAIFLALGRSLGETMAVTMVIGNVHKISLSLFDPGYSMAAVIANEFAEATSDMYVHALIAIGLSLFGITIVINGLARYMIYKMGKTAK
ncbi:MAG: phosphate ABC transporter permease subunit PstC [Elusimicrobiota bacterium]